MRRSGLWMLILLLLLTACGKPTEGMSEVSQTSGSTKSLTWQEQYDLGLRYLSEGNYQEAILAFTAAIEINPKQADAYVARGDAYLSIAQLSAANTEEGAELPAEAISGYENAINDYLAALAQDDTDAVVYRKAVDLYIQLGDTDAAISLLEEGVQKTGDISLSEYLEQMRLSISNTELLRVLYDCLKTNDIENAKTLMRQEEYREMSNQITDDFLYYSEDDGLGLGVYPKNFYYFGQWEEMRRSGSGIWIRATYSEDSAMESYIYEGMWADDRPNGEGKITSNQDAAKVNVEPGHTKSIKIEVSGTFSDGLYDGTMHQTSHMNNGSVHRWTIRAVNGVYQPINPVPQAIQNSQSYKERIAQGQYVISVDQNRNTTALWGNNHLKAITGFEP